MSRKRTFFVGQSWTFYVEVSFKRSNNNVQMWWFYLSLRSQAWWLCLCLSNSVEMIMNVLCIPLKELQIVLGIRRTISFLVDSEQSSQLMFKRSYKTLFTRSLGIPTALGILSIYLRELGPQQSLSNVKCHLCSYGYSKFQTWNHL